MNFEPKMGKNLSFRAQNWRINKKKIVLGPKMEKFSEKKGYWVKVGGLIKKIRFLAQKWKNFPKKKNSFCAKNGRIIKNKKLRFSAKNGKN